MVRIYYALCFAALGVYLPYFPRWLEARGIEGLAMGVIAAIMPAMGVLGPPLFGLMADALGLRGSLLRIACLGAMLGTGAIALAEALGRPLGYAGLFVAVLVFALFRAPLTMMADVVVLEDERARGTSYARTRLWGSLGFLVSALIAGRWLDVSMPVALPLAITAALAMALAVAWQVPTRSAGPPVPSTNHARALLAATDVRLFLGTAFLSQAAHASYDLCLSLHLADLGASGMTIGVAWGVGVCAEIVLMAASPPLLRRYPAQSLLAVALAGAAVRWALIAVVPSVPALVLMQPMHALSFGLVWIGCLAYIRGRAPTGALATMQGLFSGAQALGAVTGMLVWSTVYRHASGSITFAAASGVAGAALLVALAWARAQNTPRITK